MKQYRKVVVWPVVLLLTFSLGFITKSSDKYFEISKNLDIFGKVYREINTMYVEDTDPTELMRTGIDAMLESLDPYTNFISEEEVEDFRFMSTGQYGGIGAVIGKREERILVLEPYEGYPADKAGLKAGDQVIRIDDVPISGKEKNVSDVRSLLRGEKGTEVRLTILRGGKTEAQTLTLTRDRIRVSNVPYFGIVRNDIGYISLTGFTQDAGQEVEKATLELKKQNPDLRGIVLDLRGNPGGRLDESVNVANVFVDQGEKIVETRGRMDGSRRIHAARRLATDTEIPLAILVNHRSASASEIVSGSIQDLDRGVIIGQRSFGKGLVQNIRSLSYNTQLKVTTAKYYTPSGRCIQAINYGERDETGAVIRIADSLRNQFYTRNNRLVYDGGGVQPDIEVAIKKDHLLTQELDKQGLIFDYATLFTDTHPAIVEPAKFQITDLIYDEFIRYIRKRKFDYTTQAHDQLSELETIIEAEAVRSDFDQELAALKWRLDQQKELDLNKYRDQISRVLRQTIIKRYYYNQGAIIASLDDDPEVKAAIKVLTNPDQYRRVLSGKHP